MMMGFLAFSSATFFRSSFVCSVCVRTSSSRSSIALKMRNFPSFDQWGADAPWLNVVFVGASQPCVAISRIWGVQLVVVGKIGLDQSGERRGVWCLFDRTVIEGASSG